MLGSPHPWSLPRDITRAMCKHIMMAEPFTSGKPCAYSVDVVCNALHQSSMMLYRTPCHPA